MRPKAGEFVDLQQGESLSSFARRNHNQKIKHPTGQKQYKIKGIASDGRKAFLIVEKDDGYCTVLTRSATLKMVYCSD